MQGGEDEHPDEVGTSAGGTGSASITSPDALTDVDDVPSDSLDTPEPTSPPTSSDDALDTPEPTSPSIFDTPTDQPEPTVDDMPPPPAGPVLPANAAKVPPPMVDPIAHPRPGVATWYRTDEERSKSVYRRANPWYRRLARGLIGVAFLGVAAIGLYAGARALQGWLDRDQLPAAGAEVPEIRSTSFIVLSAAPAPTLDGTLTIDTESRAFEFVGRAGGPQEGLQLVSTDGATVYVRRGAAPWRAATSSDAAVDDVLTAVRYLADDDTADDILTNRLRRGFVDLDEEVDEGTGDDALVRYEMSVDTRRFALDYPLQWQEYRDDAVPGAQEGPAIPVTIWLDTSDVLVRVRDEVANWSWERLTYGDQPFRPIDPANDTQAQVVQVACVSADNRVFWQTPFPSCDAALAAARAAASDAAVAGAFDDLDTTIARLCSTMERDDGPLPATVDEVTLATALVEASVCRGDPSIFTTG